MYLKEDITGAASLIQYGMKWEKVEVILIRDNMALVKGSTGLFHVRVEKLTDKINLNGN